MALSETEKDRGSLLSTAADVHVRVRPANESLLLFPPSALVQGSGDSLDNCDAEDRGRNVRRKLCLDGTPAENNSISLRDRVAQVHYNVFTNRMNVMVLGISSALILVGLLHPQAVCTTLYQVIEGAVMLLFVTEVGLRLMVMRSSFWESSVNIIEAAACVICALIFSFLQMHWYTVGTTAKQEHWLLLLMRYFAQMLRMIGIVSANPTWNHSSYSDTIQVFRAGENGALHNPQPSRRRRDSAGVEKSARIYI